MSAANDAPGPWLARLRGLYAIPAGEAPALRARGRIEGRARSSGG